jgi:hypothetical protein
MQLGVYKYKGKYIYYAEGGGRGDEDVLKKVVEVIGKFSMPPSKFLKFSMPRPPP